ncbi:MAG TPA: hypothetical protein VJ032_11910, partial [Thermoanaerobaculia bacterium]|nr:hypothetical protein [Thermoanaerobaculia bacterium]
MAKRVAAMGFLILAGAAAVGPIRSYDFFWHLTTGRWIIEHHSLPLYDPFTLASAHIPWINGEWLYQIGLYAVQSLVGLRGVSWLNGLFIGAIFTVAFWFADSDLGVALFVTAIAFAGVGQAIGIRPAAAAALLLVCAIALLGSRLTPPRLAIAYALVTVVWINTHPSALLAPLLAAATLLIDLRRWMVVVASALALLINPFGWRAIAAPLELTKMVSSGEFVNAEWLPSAPALFPLFYVTLTTTVAAYLLSKEKWKSAWRAAIFVVLAVLAIQHVRNQSLYFAALP